MNEQIKVLLIDDQSMIGEAVRRMLAPESDISFYYCSDPTEALDVAEQCQPTVILQDLVMPQMEGLLLVQFFRSQDAATCHTPLIVLSSKEEPIIKAKAFELGANDYLVKLPDRVELIARIRYHSTAYTNFLKRQEAEALFKAEIMRQAAYIEQVDKVTTAASEVERDAFQPDMIAEVAKRSDELGQLARVFTQMVKTVKAREKELTDLLEAYGRFVPHEYLKFLRRQSITDVQLGDHVSKIMAVMFSDIRSFTTMSEKMTPKENFAFVNTYLQKVSPSIRNNHGLIVKFLGDGMMAVFPEVPDDAVSAGISLFRAVESFNEERKNAGERPIKIGIGIHVGHIMLGMVGEANRMQGDAFSDNVNLTARLEGLTKFYGVSLLISQQTFEQLTHADAYQLRFLDRAIVKGREEPIALYEVLDAESVEMRNIKLETKAEFEKGIQHFSQKEELGTAKQCFENVLAINPADKTAHLYLQRIQTLEEKGIPDNWNGVWTFTEK